MRIEKKGPFKKKKGKPVPKSRPREGKVYSMEDDNIILQPRSDHTKIFFHKSTKKKPVAKKEGKKLTAREAKFEQMMKEMRERRKKNKGKKNTEEVAKRA